MLFSGITILYFLHIKLCLILDNLENEFEDLQQASCLKIAFLRCLSVDFFDGITCGTLWCFHTYPKMTEQRKPEK